MPETTRRILLIDDDEGIREVAQASLELVGGYHVTTAGSGQDGLDAARTNAYDAILLDVMMPGMDGPATFARLQDQAETMHIPVVLLTAKTQEADRRRFAGLGVTGILTKPFDPMKLTGQVAVILGWEQ